MTRTEQCCDQCAFKDVAVDTAELCRKGRRVGAIVGPTRTSKKGSRGSSLTASIFPGGLFVA